jgi:pimeloyl-ACP methyl ester carboxylesterase
LALALLLCAPIVLLIFTGVIYQAIGAARDARRFPPPGRMIDAGGFRLHLQESGSSDGPVVVLESGIAASSLSWSRVAQEVAKFARVVRYDRAGLGWSERASTPRAAAQCAQELRRLLENAGIRGPVVLVGHSFGGYVARIFASQFPGQVAGLVLLDNPSTSEWTQLSLEGQRKLQGGALFSRIGAVLARLGVVRFCLARLSAGSANLPVMVTRTFGRSALTVVGRLVGEVQKLPAGLWPQVQAHWCQPKAFHSMASHLAYLPQSAAQVEAFSMPTNIPVLVLTASKPDAARHAAQETVAGLSTQGKHIVATTSGHWIQLDEPELVLEAIRAVCDTVKLSAP